MTLPGWIGPDAQDEPAGLPSDDAARRPEAEHQPETGREETAGDTAADLRDKPVLEWTDADWASWVDSAAAGSPRTAGDTADASGGDGRGRLGAQIETEDADSVEADPPPPAPSLPFGPVAAGPAALRRESPSSSAPSPAGEEGPAVHREPLVERSDVDREPGRVDAEPVGGVDADVADDADDADEEPLDLDPDATTVEPPDVSPVVTVVEPRAFQPESEPAANEPVAEAEPEPAHLPPIPDEWAGVSDHVWWESAPVRTPEPVVFDDEPPTLVEAPTAPPLAPIERPAVASSPAGTPARPARPAPASTPSPRSVVRPQSPAPEVGHRVRSALSLLGVAISVGVVVAGLITVAIFAISLALRQAAG